MLRDFTALEKAGRMGGCPKVQCSDLGNIAAGNWLNTSPGPGSNVVVSENRTDSRVN